jgi:F-type H+-transporting ATPase subunit b
MNANLNGISSIAFLSGALAEAEATEGHPAQAATEVSGTHAETQAHGGSSLPPFLRFDPGVSIWTIVTFVLLLVVLKKLAWKPILESLDEREKSIKQSMDQAQKLQGENARLAEEQRRILDASRTEAAGIVQTAREAAEALRRQVEQAAQAEKARILSSAQQEIDTQKRAALAELRKTTADLSIQIAEKLIRQNLDDAKNRALVDQLIAEVGKAKG